MATKRKVKVGDPVSHEGNWIGHKHENTDFVITRLEAGGEDPDDPLRRLSDFIAYFENDRYRVKCLTGDLEWLDEDNAWALPGRLLTRAQRQVFCILTESPSCSPKAHQSARFALLQDSEATDKAFALIGSATLLATNGEDVSDG